MVCCQRHGAGSCATERRLRLQHEQRLFIARREWHACRLELELEPVVLPPPVKLVGAASTSRASTGASATTSAPWLTLRQQGSQLCIGGVVVQQHRSGRCRKVVIATLESDNHTHWPW